MASPQASPPPFPVRIERILFANNFSETSATALPYAAALARRFGAEIVAVHVIPSEEYAYVPPEQLGARLAEMEAVIAERVHALVEATQFADIAIRVQIEHGEVLTAIAWIAAKEGIDLIVTGSHGRHGIQKLIVPSLDQQIATTAPCPVLLVGPEITVAPEAEARIERILFATDFETVSRPALNFAYALVRAYSAQLLFLHVTEDVWQEPLSTRMSAEAFCRLRMLERGLPEPSPDIDVSFHVDFGSRELLILEAAENWDVQLIVMGVPGAAHPELTSHLPGPLAYDIASHAPCPVLAVRFSTTPSTFFSDRAK
jgi:nucleotide-binding universal stress UspA family protein